VSETEVVQRGRRHRVNPGAFYRSALSAGEKEMLPVADEVQGLDQEIAVLRVRLRQALEEHPENMTLMLKGVELLVKAVGANYRLSKEAKADLSANVKAVLEEYGPMISPESNGDVDADAGEDY
jgi:hypothetical protein